MSPWKIAGLAFAALFVGAVLAKVLFVAALIGLGACVLAGAWGIHWLMKP